MGRIGIGIGYMRHTVFLPKCDSSVCRPVRFVFFRLPKAAYQIAFSCFKRAFTRSRIRRNREIAPDLNDLRLISVGGRQCRRRQNFKPGGIFSKAALILMGKLTRAVYNGTANRHGRVVVFNADAAHRQHAEAVRICVKERLVQFFLF